MSQKEIDIRRFYRNSKSDKTIRFLSELFCLTEEEIRALIADCKRIKLPHYHNVGKFV